MFIPTDLPVLEQHLTLANFLIEKGIEDETMAKHAIDGFNREWSADPAKRRYVFEGEDFRLALVAFRYLRDRLVLERCLGL